MLSRRLSPPPVGPEGESLKFELTVADHGGLQAQDTCIVNVTWQNTPPSAAAGENQVVVAGSTVALDASRSMDGDDAVAFFYWAQVAGTPVTLSDPTAALAIFTAPGASPHAEPLIFHLTVTDTRGLKHSDTCQVAVQPAGVAGDLDGDTIVDCNDYLTFAAAYNACSGDSNYTALADPDGDGCITDADRASLYPSGLKICDLSVQAKNGRIILAWTSVGADSYTIYRKIQGEQYTFLADSLSPAATYSDRDVINGLTYYYLVTGDFGGLESEDSNEVSAIPQAPGKNK